MSRSVTLWCSYVGRGAPSNAAGGRIGYGATREQAREAAGHWANQAPFAKFRRITITDQGSVSVVPEADQIAAAEIIPDLACPEHEFAAPELRKASVEAWCLANAGKTASAILRYTASLP